MRSLVLGPKYPPLLLKYLKAFQDNPKSRVFAPLAEAYRKIGLIDEAIDICYEGLQANPSFTGGKVALARALTDKKLYSKVKEVLLPIIDQIPDNLMAQKLLADSCLVLGFLAEALNAYKMILYFNPMDSSVASLVQELEVQSFQSPEKIRKLMKLQRMLRAVQQTATY